MCLLGATPNHPLFLLEYPMPFEYYGREHDTVWEQEIVRYHFTVGEEVTVQNQFNQTVTALPIGTHLKINKREAHKYFTQGYIEWSVMSYREDSGRWERRHFQLRNGNVSKDIETRVLKQYEVQPHEVAPPKRKKK